MPTVRIPSPLWGLSGGRSRVEVDGTDLRAVLANLQVVCPGIVDRIVADDGRVRPHVHVFVADRDVARGQGLATPVGAEETVTIVPAVAGGADG